MQMNSIMTIPAYESNASKPRVKTKARSSIKNPNFNHKDLAQKLHKAKVVYAVYGLLDGLSLSYSMVKYIFDLHFSDSNISSDRMHEWMMTPAGALAVGSESVLLIVWSMMGNVFKDDDPKLFKRYAALFWGYNRLALKALKNAYKGVRGFLQMTNVLGLGDYRSYVVPVGLMLGILSSLNRMAARYAVNQRKDMMENNASLLNEVIAHNNDYFSSAEIHLKEREQFTTEIAQKFLGRIAYQDKRVQWALLGSAAYAGVVDGLYLYMGVLGLSALAPQMFLAMSVCSTLFVVGCVLIRMYEEYDYQRKLTIEQLKIKLAIVGRELEELLIKEVERLIEYAREHEGQFPAGTYINIDAKYQEFNQAKATLQSSVLLSSLSAALAGLKDGLAAYSAILSVLFASSAVLAISGTAIPTFMVISAVTAGMLAIAILVSFSLFVNYQTHKNLSVVKQEQPLSPEPSKVNAAEGEVNRIVENQPLLSLLNLLKKNQNKVSDLKPADLREVIENAKKLDPSPQFYFQEWFEVFRSFFSGVNKGQKSIDYTLNPMQAPGTDGHYHDTPMMSLLAVFSALFHCVGFALRAHARGFGRPGLGSQPTASNPPQKQQGGAVPVRLDKIEREESGPHTEEVYPQSSPLSPHSTPSHGALPKISSSSSGFFSRLPQFEPADDRIERLTSSPLPALS